MQDKFRRTLDTVDPDNGNKYYEGVLTEKHTTNLGHYFISISQPKAYYGDKLVTLKYPYMNFIVPKRRERIWQTVAKLNLGCKILVKLMEESRSGKMCVAELEVRGG